MGKTEQQLLNNLLLSPTVSGPSINVEDYRRLCAELEKNSKRIVYVDANGIGLQKTR